MEEVKKLKNLIISKDGQVAIITINRPEKKNVFDTEVWLDLEIAAEMIENMEDARAVVINAAGDIFSAGIDLAHLNQVDSNKIRKTISWTQSVYSRWDSFPIPVIAAVQGLCLGSATELILACDIRIAARDAVIAIPEVRFGLAPDMGGTTRLTRLIGPGQAKRLILGCEQIDAEEAKSIGLVEIVTDKEELMEKALKLAKRIAAQPPIGVLMAKKGINLAVESSLMAGMLFEQAQSILCCGTEDQKEAISAFFAKRKPDFKGK